MSDSIPHVFSYFQALQIRNDRLQISDQFAYYSLYGERLAIAQELGDITNVSTLYFNARRTLHLAGDNDKAPGYSMDALREHFY